MCVLVRCEILRRHSRGRATAHSSIILAQVFDIRVRLVIFSIEGLLKQRVVILALLPTGMS